MPRRILMLLAAASFIAPGPALCAQGITLTRSLQELEEAARKDSNDAEAQYNVALGYWSKQRYDDAERTLRLAVTIDPRFAPGWLALGVLPYARRPKLREEIAKGKVPDQWKAALDESQRLMRRAFLIDPLVDLTILGAVEAPQGLTIGTRRGVIVVYVNPFAAFQAGRYAQAFWTFDRWMHGADGRPLPRDSISPAVLWYRGLSAAHL